MKKASAVRVQRRRRWVPTAGWPWAAAGSESWCGCAGEQIDLRAARPAKRRRELDDVDVTGITMAPPLCVCIRTCARVRVPSVARRSRAMQLQRVTSTNFVCKS